VHIREDQRLGFVGWLVFAAAWVPYAALARRFWFVNDDAFISLRYARNWAEGHGPRYNLTGDLPVEGYSNFLWVALGAFFERLGIDPVAWLPLVSFACGSLLLFLVFRVIAVRLSVPLPVAWLATLALGCSQPFAVWSSGGLATMPHALLVFLAFDLLGLRPDRRACTVAAAIAGAALTLIRVEGFAWAMLVALAAALARGLEGRRVLRPLAVYVGFVVLVFAAHVGWRWSYYGSPIPNTVHVKVGMTGETLLRGLRYVAAWFASYLTPLVLVPATLVALTRSWCVAALPALLFVAGNLVYAVTASGDFMTSFRLLLPAVVFTSLLLAVLLAELWERGGGPRIVAAAFGAAVVIAGLLPSWNIHLAPQGLRDSLSVREVPARFRTEFEQWRIMAEQEEKWRVKGQTLARVAAPDATIVQIAIGAVGYYSGLELYDRQGLVTREVALRPHEGPLRTPGHDKLVPTEFFLDREPTYLNAAVIEQRENAIQKLTKWGARAFDDYLPEIVRVDEALGSERWRWLVLLRRIRPGEDREAAWSAIEAGL
jgi:hypothetical protein